MLKNQRWLSVLLIIGMLFVSASGAFANAKDEDDGYMTRSEIEHFMEMNSEEDTEQSQQLNSELVKYLEENEEYLFEDVASIVDKYHAMDIDKTKKKAFN